ncbi:MULTISPECIES: helix-turn-helix domain-containing protein [unclassified Streptomyces]|uniref:helix-turn-helix domain-containing protein n=1 Tax=unclassified Streptomyces TaxID=2593676 RepID=UPI0037F73246
MPGGRLTQQERQRIALGLADGLPYAEIARRLDRPTSTVTREVMRNGGPAGYRADLAHRATEQRAHRSGRTASRPTAPAPQPHGRDAGAVRAYEEAFTTVLMQSGMPQMTARVMAAICLADSGSLTASELVQHLGVSPASVSKAITFLDSQGFVTRQRDERRRERYVVDDDVWYRSMMASARSTAHISGTAREGAGVFGPGTPAGARLENIARFLDFVSESIARAAEQARDILHAKPSPASTTDLPRSPDAPGPEEAEETEEAEEAEETPDGSGAPHPSGAPASPGAPVSSAASA